MGRLKWKYHRTYPLHNASGEHGHLADVKVLVETGGQDVNEIDDGGKTPVYHAAYNDKKGVVRYLMSKGAKEEDKNSGILDLLKKKYHHTYPLHVASGEKSNLADVKVLVETCGQGVNEIDDGGRGKTPVYRAAYHDKKDVVRYLMSKGAKADDKKRGNCAGIVDRLKKKYENECPRGTALVCACEKGRLEDVRVLVENHDVENTGMSVDEMVSKEGKDSDFNSITPLHKAAGKGQLEIIQYLVKTCPTVDLIGGTKSKYGCNSLHYAACCKNVQTLEFLIDNYNGDIKNIINQETSSGGTTPLDYAYRWNHFYSVREDIGYLLRKYGAKSNVWDKNGNQIPQKKRQRW